MTADNNRGEPLLMRTPRLILASPQVGQGAAYAAFHTANLEFHSHWLPSLTGDFESAAYWENKIAERQQLLEEGREVHLMLWYYDVFVGQIAFTHMRSDPFFSAEVTFSLDEKVLRQKMMFEGLQHALEQVASRFKLHRFEARYMPRNDRAGKVIRRVGFTVEGCNRGYALVNGRWEDHIVASRLMHV